MAILRVVGRVRQVGRSSGCYLTTEVLMQASRGHIWGKVAYKEGAAGRDYCTMGQDSAPNDSASSSDSCIIY